MCQTRTPAPPPALPPTPPPPLDVARDAAGDEGGRILGVTSGFLLTPLGLMHCDMLQIFTRG